MVMFLHLSVSHSVHSVHRGSASVHAGIHPLEQTPQDQTPPGANPYPRAVHAGRYRQQASGTHPTGRHTCYRPQQSWGKVIFSEACVKNSVHGGCTCPQAGKHLPERYTPSQGRYTPLLGR